MTQRTEILFLSRLLLTWLLSTLIIESLVGNNQSPLFESIDIGLFNTDCGAFEVRARPQSDLTDVYLTNIQFTLSWPTGTVELDNFLSETNIEQQGPVLQHEGINYAVFVSATGSLINWTANQEYVVLSFNHDQSGEGYADFTIADDNWSSSNNGEYYIEVLGTDATGIIYQNALNCFLEPCGLIDGVIYNTACGEFEVRLLPHDNYLNSQLTNLQFTISWPENTVDLIDFTTDYDLLQQGPVINDNGINYAVFVSASGIGIDWLKEVEYSVLSFRHDQSGDGYADFLLAEDEWVLNNNGVFYIEILGLEKTGLRNQQALNTYLGTCGVIDIGLFETDCSEFEVRLNPHDDYPENAVTNIQFTIQWPANTVEFLNFNSDFNVQPQGNPVEFEGMNYQVFVSTTGLPINWEAETEYTILNFQRTSNGNIFIDFTVSTDPWTIDNNGMYYLELLGANLTGEVYHNALNTFIGTCGTVEIKTFLQGPYNSSSGLMNTSLNSSGDLPLAQPYSTTPWNYYGDETLSEMSADVVDWILVELRTGPSETDFLERKAGLLLNNGMIVQHDDITSGVTFENLITGEQYYIVVWHRNHIPVMSGSPVELPNEGSPYDFTEVNITQPYLHDNPTSAVLELGATGSGIYGMIGGDLNADGKIKYTGANNDRDLIAQTLYDETGSPYLFMVVNGYYLEDYNLDAQVKYTGAGNDRDGISANLYRLTGSVYLFQTYNSVVPGAIDTD